MGSRPRDAEDLDLSRSSLDRQANGACHEGKNDDLDNESKLPALIVSFGMLGVLVALIVDAYSNQTKIAIGGTEATQTLANGQMSAMSKSVIYNYVFPFEVVGVLLLAALIGAVVLARKD